MHTFSHSGDLGDIIYSLAVAERLGGGTFYFVDRPAITKPFTPARMAAIKPLLEFQAYIHEVHCTEPQRPCSHDFVNFRAQGWVYGDSLVRRHARWLGVKDLDGSVPWLCAPEHSASKDRVVLHRSPRYQSKFFPWRAVGEFYGDRLLCVGFGEEVQALCKALGREVEHYEAEDYLDLASLIGSADLFIGNQSSPMALAIGLGAPFIQETCDWMPDCIYRRANAQYVYDGGVVLPGLGQGEDCTVEPFVPALQVDEFVSPPGGWRYGTHRDLNLFELCRRVETLVGVSKAEVRRAAIEHMKAAAREEHCRKHRSANFGRLDDLILALGVDAPGG